MIDSGAGTGKLALAVAAALAGGRMIAAEEPHERL